LAPRPPPPQLPRPCAPALPCTLAASAHRRPSQSAWALDAGPPSPPRSTAGWWPSAPAPRLLGEAGAGWASWPGARESKRGQRGQAGGGDQGVGESGPGRYPVPSVPLPRSPHASTKPNHRGHVEMKKISTIAFCMFMTSCGHDEGEYCGYERDYPPDDYKCPTLENAKKGLIGYYLVQFHGKVVDVKSGPVEKRPNLNSVSCCYQIEYIPE